MTDPSIPPCPVCGKTPKGVQQRIMAIFHMYKCCITPEKVILAVWQRLCDEHLGRALRTTHNIHTLAQLTERLAPDPRVEVMRVTDGVLDADLRAVIAGQRGDGQ